MEFKVLSIVVALLILGVSALINATTATTTSNQSNDRRDKPTSERSSSNKTTGAVIINNSDTIDNNKDKNTNSNNNSSPYFVFGAPGDSQTYRFGYDSQVKGAPRLMREESKLTDGTVVGRYGYTDPFGVFRIVQYVAGPHGYYATEDIAGSSPSTPLLFKATARQVDGSSVGASEKVKTLAADFNPPLYHPEAHLAERPPVRPDDPVIGITAYDIASVIVKKPQFFSLTGYLEIDDRAAKVDDIVNPVEININRTSTRRTTTTTTSRPTIVTASVEEDSLRNKKWSSSERPKKKLNFVIKTVAKSGNATHNSLTKWNRQRFVVNPVNNNNRSVVSEWRIENRTVVASLIKKKEPDFNETIEFEPAKLTTTVKTNDSSIVNQTNLFGDRKNFTERIFSYSFSILNNKTEPNSNQTKSNERIKFNSNFTKPNAPNDTRKVEEIRRFVNSMNKVNNSGNIFYAPQFLTTRQANIQNYRLPLFEPDVFNPVNQSQQPIILAEADASKKRVGDENKNETRSTVSLSSITTTTRISMTTATNTSTPTEVTAAERITTTVRPSTVLTTKTTTKVFKTTPSTTRIVKILTSAVPSTFKHTITSLIPPTFSSPSVTSSPASVITTPSTTVSPIPSPPTITSTSPPPSTTISSKPLKETTIKLTNSKNQTPAKPQSSDHFNYLVDQTRSAKERPKSENRNSRSRTLDNTDEPFSTIMSEILLLPVEIAAQNKQDSSQPTTTKLFQRPKQHQHPKVQPRPVILLPIERIESKEFDRNSFNKFYVPPLPTSPEMTSITSSIAGASALDDVNNGYEVASISKNKKPEEVDITPPPQALPSLNEDDDILLTVGDRRVEFRAVQEQVQQSEAVDQLKIVQRPVRQSIYVPPLDIDSYKKMPASNGQVEMPEVRKRVESKRFSSSDNVNLSFKELKKIKDSNRFANNKTSGLRALFEVRTDDKTPKIKNTEAFTIDKKNNSSRLASHMLPLPFVVEELTMRETT